MTTQRIGTLHLQFGVTLMSVEELTKKVEHLLERTLTREEYRFPCPRQRIVGIESEVTIESAGWGSIEVLMPRQATAANEGQNRAHHDVTIIPYRVNCCEQAM